MKKGQFVRIYEDGLVGETSGVLIECYGIIQAGIIERWLIETENKTKLVRVIKNTSFKCDGCGYIGGSYE